MQKSLFRLAAAAAIALFSSPALSAQTAAQAKPASVELPVARVALFSSGVAYFEHRGSVAGEAVVPLPFRAEEVNDALKSLVIWDGAAARSGSLSVSYPTNESLDRALKGFRVDLSGSPAVADMLARLRGAELEIDAPDRVAGRIVGVERRPDPALDGEPSPCLVLLAKDGLRAIRLHEVAAFRFADSRIAEDFERALALILSAQDSRRRVLDVRLPGAGSREVTIGYVVAAPVWKAAYRLDLSGGKPYLQGWAIVDNPSDQDWKEVSLSLVSGRPVSFVQDLYRTFYLERPLVPLAIAGTAAPRSFDSALEEEWGDELFAEVAPEPSPEASSMGSGSGGYAKAAAEPMDGRSAAPKPRAGLASASMEGAEARAAGDLFEFTLRRPVTLERRRSAMLPLVSAEIAAEKVSVLSPGATRPMLGARLSNVTGMKLPAGPITVFDGDLYAGDALLDFLPEKDRRLIVYGEDLSVSADSSSSSVKETMGVTVSKGVMTFSRRTTWTRTYGFRNAGAEPRSIVIEHPITAGAELFEPKLFDERTGELYRFSLALPAGAQANLEVKERSPSRETVSLAKLGTDSFLAYASSKEIPEKVREALGKAVDLKRKAEDAKRLVSELQSRRTELSNEQGRIRQNLEAVGRDSSQGQQYLKRLMDAEAELDRVATRLEEGRKALQDATADYEGYLAALVLE